MGLLNAETAERKQIFKDLNPNNKLFSHYFAFLAVPGLITIKFQPQLNIATGLTKIRKKQTI
jgi:hypothetical protein